MLIVMRSRASPTSNGSSATCRRNRSAVWAVLAGSVSAKGGCEFLAAYPANNVGAPNHRAAAIGDSAQHLVPDGMAVPVVDPLEIVGVDHHHGKRQLVIKRALEFAFEGREELAAVQDFRQIVDGCENLELLRCRYEVRHIGESQHPPAIREDLADELEDAAVPEPEMLRQLSAGSYQGHAIGDVLVHGRFRNVPEGYLPGVVQYVGIVKGFTRR
jgi:hypothetical protein